MFYFIPNFKSLLRPYDSYRLSMECAIGMARRAMALPDFKLVGPAIHLALPKIFKKLSTYLNIFINIFIFFKVNHRKNNKLNH